MQKSTSLCMVNFNKFVIWTKRALWVQTDREKTLDFHYFEHKISTFTYDHQDP